MARDFDKEYREFQGTKQQIKRRSMTNQARRIAGCGKGQEVDHIRPLSKGGTNAKSNLRCVSRSANRKKGNR